jgi:TolA-binding protein
VAEDEVVEEPPEEVVEDAVVEPSPARRRPRPAPSPPEGPEEDEPSPPAADATLHAEIALLRPAQKALRAGDHARALRLLDDHAKSFPRSVLAPERSLGRIQALCGLGRETEARQQIEAFGKKYPGSPLAGRVKKACPASESP